MTRFNYRTQCNQSHLETQHSKYQKKVTNVNEALIADYAGLISTVLCFLCGSIVRILLKVNLISIQLVLNKNPR